MAESLFLLNLPNTGSTAMARLLLSSRDVWSTWPTGEGQWVPEVTDMMRADPWNPEIDFDWRAIRTVWESLKPAGARIMLEKSPPNVIRRASIEKVFPDAFFVVTNRDPYAWTSSVLHRSFSEVGHDEEKRRAAIERHARAWVVRTGYQIGNLQALRGRSLVWTYELFCLWPNVFLQNIYGVFGDLGIDSDTEVTVKDYPPAPITNMNERQIGLLTPSDIDLVTEILRPHEDTVRFFGYRLREDRTASPPLQE